MAFMIDNVRLVDGPLEGRLFAVDQTPSGALDFHAAVGPDGSVLAVEGEPAPVNVPFKPCEYRYAPLLAADGQPSRDEEGCLLFQSEAIA